MPAILMSTIGLFPCGYNIQKIGTELLLMIPLIRIDIYRCHDTIYGIVLYNVCKIRKLYIILIKSLLKVKVYYKR